MALYSLEHVQRLAVATRTRYRGDVIIPGVPPRDEIAEALAQAMRRIFVDHGDADAAVLYAYHRRQETVSSYTVGVAWASRDSKGWDRDGSFDAHWMHDEGQIHITLRDATSPGSDPEYRSIPF